MITTHFTTHKNYSIDFKHILTGYLTFNPFVVGSIPAQPPSITKGLRENVAL
jgi:hypothetical protein